MDERPSSGTPAAAEGGAPLRFAIFIVAYNAVTTLRKVLDRIPPEAWDQVEEVYVFDDASQDDTELLGLGYKATRGIDKLKVYRNEVNLGYGGNQKRGYQYAMGKGFDYVLLLHGDGQYAPELIPEFIAKAKAHRPAAIFGSRMMARGAARRGGMPLYKYVGNRILTVTENLLLGSRLSEFHSGYRMYSVAALRRLHFPAYTDDFHFDTQIIVELIHRGLPVLEIPIPTYYGDEICYVNGMRYAWDVLLSVLRFKLFSLGLVSCDWIGEKDQPARRYPAKSSPLSSHRRIVRLVPSGSRVLDVGAEVNYVAALVAKGCELVGVNDRDPGPEVTSQYAAYRVADLDREPLPSPAAVGRFDYVVLADVLEHIRPAAAVLASAKGLLAQDGRIIASTGNVANWTVRLSLLAGRFTYRPRGILDESHVHLYTRRTFRRLLTGQGYTIVRSKVTPIPFELFAGPGSLSRAFWKAVELAYYPLARLWPTLFAYQFILVAVPTRGARAQDEEPAHPPAPRQAAPPRLPDGDRAGAPEGASCEFCGSRSLVAMCENRDFLTLEPFTLVRCEACGIARTRFPYPQAELARYYGVPYYGEGGRRFFAPMEWLIQRFRGGRARLVRRLHPAPGSVLDVGCGRALMLGQLKALGWRCAGTEFSEEMAASATDRHGLEIRVDDLEHCGFEGASFDVVTLWHSLEHMEHPLSALAEAARLLTDGGFLVVEVPNLESLQASLGGGRWFHLDAPRHQVHLGRSQLLSLLGRVGLEPVRQTTASLELGFYGMWQTLLNLDTARPNVLYLLLRRFKPAAREKRNPLRRAAAAVWDLSATVFLLAPAVVVGTVLEGAACLARRGGIIRVVARKPGAAVP